MISTLIRDALKDFETFKELTETIPLEVLAAEAEGLGKSQQQLFQEFSLRLTVPDLAQRVRQCTTWEEIEQVIASAPFLKQEIWALLTLEEKERIKILKITAALPIDPNCESLLGKRVFVTAGRYRQAGEGMVECDRGFDTLRLLEVRMKDGKIQVLGLSDARQVT